MGRETTPLEHTAIGAFAGVVEVTVMQPTVALKNALQVRSHIHHTFKIPIMYTWLEAT
jgi:hypothetical protein